MSPLLLLLFGAGGLYLVSKRKKKRYPEDVVMIDRGWSIDETCTIAEAVDLGVASDDLDEFAMSSYETAATGPAEVYGRLVEYFQTFDECVGVPNSPRIIRHAGRDDRTLEDIAQEAWDTDSVLAAGGNAPAVIGVSLVRGRR